MQPMHSQSALTEHVSLNLARFFLLDPVVRNEGAAFVVRWRWLLARSGLAVGGRAGDLHRPTHSLPLHCHTTAPAVVLDRGRFRAIRENRYCIPNMRQTFCCVPSCATYATPTRIQLCESSCRHASRHRIWPTAARGMESGK